MIIYFDTAVNFEPDLSLWKRLFAKKSKTVENHRGECENRSSKQVAELQKEGLGGRIRAFGAVYRQWLERKFVKRCEESV